ncbi:MAG: dUTP diphosphatase [Desulfosalsimonas sp.]
MSDAITVKCRRVRPDSDRDIPPPQYMTAQSAGMDLYAAVKDSVTLAAGEITLIPTGFAIALPPDHEAQIRPRSGLAVKHGIGLINSPGTIDADYRGEIQVALINHGKSPYTVNRGDRIAQMIVAPVCRTKVDLVDTLAESERNSGGFGHTGV